MGGVATGNVQRLVAAEPLLLARAHRVGDGVKICPNASRQVSRSSATPYGLGLKRRHGITPILRRLFAILPTFAQ